jgi:hypothetical protein
MGEQAHQPKRVQLSRRKGWRMPANAINVARPSVWGNPFRIGDVSRDGDVIASREEAVRLYRLHVVEAPSGHDYEELRGKDLACWCPLDEPCHADVLLERANRRR